MTWRRAPIRVALTKGDGGRVWCESVPLAAVPCFRLAAEQGLRFRAGGREIPVPADIAGASVTQVAVGAEPDGLSLWVFAGRSLARAGRRRALRRAPSRWPAATARSR